MADPIYDTQNLTTGTHVLLTIINRNASTGQLEPVACDSQPLLVNGKANTAGIRKALLHQHYTVTQLLKREHEAAD
jgi:hypothetical protein